MSYYWELGIPRVRDLWVAQNRIQTTSRGAKLARLVAKKRNAISEKRIATTVKTTASNDVVSTSTLPEIERSDKVLACR